jgi:hypothetical protein
MIYELGFQLQILALEIPSSWEEWPIYDPNEIIGKVILESMGMTDSSLTMDEKTS